MPSCSQLTRRLLHWGGADLPHAGMRHQAVLGAALVVFGFLIATKLSALMSPRGRPPECRKAGVAVVFPGSAPELVVWAGKGNHRDSIFDDMHKASTARLFIGSRLCRPA